MACSVSLFPLNSEVRFRPPSERSRTMNFFEDEILDPETMVKMLSQARENIVLVESTLEYIAARLDEMKK